MSVNYVGGNTATSGLGTGTSQVINYTPIPGNTIVIAVSFGGAVSNLSCVDNNGNVVNLVAFQGGNNAMFVDTAVAGATSYTVTWTTTRKSSIAAVEYSGVYGLGVVNTGSTVASGTFTFGTVIGYNNSLVVASIVSPSTSAITFTATQGTIRQQVNGGATSTNSLCVIDNLGAVTGNTVTVAGTVSTNTSTQDVAQELFPPQQSFVSSVTADDQWLGGDEY